MKHETTDMDKWDRRFFDICNLIASWSEERGRKVGAVIVGPANEIRSTGYNGLPRGIRSDVEHRHQKSEGEKYLWFEHAERNAIYNAARSGTSVEGCTLYSSLFPCADCVRAIIQSGISHLKTYSAPESDATFARSFEVSAEMLQEANVRVSVFKAYL